MDNSMDYGSECFDEEDTLTDKRMTRVITKVELQQADISLSTNSESDDSYSEGTVQNPPTKKDDAIDRLKGITSDDVRELLHKLDISENEDNSIEEINKEEESDIEEKKHKNKQKAQAKTLIKEGKKNKEEIEAKTTSKENRKNRDKEGMENDSEDKISKTKKGIKGKKNISKTTNIDAQSEENLNKVENESTKKFVVHSNNRQEENLTKPDIADFKEKNPAKSRNEKIGLQNINKEKQTKSSKRVVNDNNVKESESNALEQRDGHVEGRVMRSTRSRQDRDKNVLKPINEPLKDIDSETVKSLNKKNVKKLESEMNKLEENPESITTEEGAVGKKKKTGKKAAIEMKKNEETEVTNETNEEEKPVKNKKTGKKATYATLKESQEKPLSSVKEDTNIQTQKKHKKDESKAVLNTVQKELDSIGKSTKSKKKAVNAKENKDVEEPQPHTITEKKLRADLVKNKKLENKENKINEDTVSNKRTTRKK